MKHGCCFVYRTSLKPSFFYEMQNTEFVISTLRRNEKIFWDLKKEEDGHVDGG